MLPTKGYFQDIECPFYNTTCGRPYCHFRHKRKPNEIVDESSQESTKTTVPTYKPTPKSELASIHSQRSHIPISYVPDLSYKRERTVRPIKIDKPTYKPTPLSILSSATQPDASEGELDNSTIRNIQENIASNVYDPLKSEINFEDLNNEFEAIDNIIEESTHENLDDTKKDEDSVHLDTENAEENTEKKGESHTDLFESVKQDKVSKAEDLFDQLKKSDEVKKESEDKNRSDKDSKRSRDSKSSSSKSKHSSPSKEKSSSKDKEAKSTKDKGRDKVSEKISHKSKEKDKQHKEDSSKSKAKEKPKSKDKKRSKTKSESTTNGSESEPSTTESSPERHRKEKKKASNGSSKSSHSNSSNSKRKSRDRSESKEKSRKKSLKRSKSRSRSRSKSKEKHKHKSSSRTKDEDKKSKTKSSKERDSKSKVRESRSKSSSSKKSTKKDKDTPLVAPQDDDVLSNNDMGILDCEDALPDDIDIYLEDEDETLKECYRIFNEYKPEPIKKPEESKEEAVVEYVPTQIKKRTAHAGAEQSTNYNKIPAPAPAKPALLPGQMLANRYKIAKLVQAKNEQESIINEIKTITTTAKRPATSLLEAARLHKMKRLQRAKELEKPKDNIVDDILNGVHKTSAVNKVQSKKIAAVPNVALIEKAKQRISLVKKHQRENENVKTIAHTAKGSRVAHVPEYTLDEIPDVLQAEKSKLPVNVRTRFLTMIAEECSKLYASKDDAYNRALTEEFSCYEKCKVLATYRNSAMLAVNRLRKEVQDRDSRGLGRLLSGESSSNKKNDFEGKTFYNNVKKWILTDEELDIHGYPRESSDRGVAIINNRTEIDFSIVDENQRRCSRCGKIYQVDDDGWPLFDEECMYHPMKKRTIRREQVYLCCKSSEDTGCAMSDTHVFDGLPKHLLEGYQTTFPPESDDDPRSTQVYALDCEMCYTTKGLELTRVTVVDTECKTVYESLVKPLNPIIDYNTRFSGITKDQMDRTGTNILQVQANILHLCNSETILVGHSLESDMKALKIIHGTIIDTAVLFPHKMCLPHKKALRALASEFLQKIIQNDVSGHDSAEDAIACMDLIKWKLKEELKTKVK